jgi:hypothetical protein
MTIARLFVPPTIIDDDDWKEVCSVEVCGVESVFISVSYVVFELEYVVVG